MEARIIFDLNAPEDKRAFELYGQIDNMASALFEITHNLKRKFKHNDSIDWNTADLIFKELEEMTSEIDLERFS